MGTKISQLFEYVYIGMAIFSIYLVVDNWQEDRNRAYMFAVFAVVAVFMFFFKRNFRKKIENEQNNK